MPAWWKYRLHIAINMQVAYVEYYEKVHYLLYINTYAIYAAL